MDRVDRMAGIAALLGGILLAYTGWRLDPGTSKLPGPGFFPLLVALSMGGLGAWLFLRPGPAAKPAPPGTSRWGPFFIALFSLLAYAAVLDRLGYLISTFGFLAVQLRWVEKRNWTLSLMTAALAAGISLFLFRALLKVPLPVGILPLPKGW
jgi:putative tricarboxylic transport membrane protein